MNIFLNKRTSNFGRGVALAFYVGLICCWEYWNTKEELNSTIFYITGASDSSEIMETSDIKKG